MKAPKRLQVLQRHLASDDAITDLQAAPTASRGASLPRFDTAVMEAALDDLASLKEEVYEVFRHHPELLPASLEGLSKGVRAICVLYGGLTIFHLDYHHQYHRTSLSTSCPCVQTSTGNWSGSNSFCC